MWGVIWGAPDDLESRCARLLWKLRDTGLRERRPTRCSANIPTLAEVQPSVRRSLDRLLEGQVIDDANLFSEKLQEWEDYYNYHRPHGALSGQTPYERLRQKAQDPLS